MKTENQTQDRFQKKILADVNEEISILVRRIELNFGLSFDEARKSVFLAIKNLHQ
ncbi:hypothetical protein J4218_00150 [Candidatus Pacearchaeota archaeon]|nr:hypothetical protein [Candidatus Pacearchaeota archaeon]